MRESLIQANLTRAPFRKGLTRETNGYWGYLVGPDTPAHGPHTYKCLAGYWYARESCYLGNPRPGRQGEHMVHIKWLCLWRCICFKIDPCATCLIPKQKCLYTDLFWWFFSYMPLSVFIWHQWCIRIHHLMTAFCVTTAKGMGPYLIYGIKYNAYGCSGIVDMIERYGFYHWIHYTNT